MTAHAIFANVNLPRWVSDHIDLLHCQLFLHITVELTCEWRVSAASQVERFVGPYGDHFAQTSLKGSRCPIQRLVVQANVKLVPLVDLETLISA